MPGRPGVPDDATTLRAENGRLREANDRLRMLVEDEDAQIAELRKRVARLVSRNSGNSSMPPSSDDQPGKKPPERTGRRGGGRKPGKQPGAHLAWREDPNERVDHYLQSHVSNPGT